MFMHLLLGSFKLANRRDIRAVRPKGVTDILLGSRSSLAPEPCQKIRCELRSLDALAARIPFEARKLRDYGKNEQRFADAQPCPASVTH